MGACQFTEIALGKDMETAFRGAVDRAGWEHGHGGYSGTIAEKHGAASFGAVPPRMKPRDFASLLWAASAYLDTECWTEDGYGRPKRGTPAYAHWAKGRDAWTKLKAAFGLASAQSILATMDDKWGDAAAFEVTGKAAADTKERAGRKGTRDKVFMFIGWASS